MATAAEYGLGPNPFPRGWFVVAESSELDQGPMAVRFWGRDLALYRGESGKPVMLDAYCAHMGTHLTGATSAMIVKNGEQIEGDSIRCPYHGWRYNDKGDVDDIPYHDGPCPKSASIRSYPVVDSLGAVLAWFDPDGGEPEYEAPSLAETDDPQWVMGPLDHLGELDIHPQEILDNMADMAHLGPTHGAPSQYFENEFRDHIYIQRQGGPMQLYGGAWLYTTTWYTGPGILRSKQVWENNEIYELIFNTPIDDGRVKCWHGVIYKSASAEATEADVEIQKGYQAGALEAFAADFNVWASKRPALKIMQLKSDGPFKHGRKWYSQFHAEQGSVAPIREELNGKVGTLGMRSAEEAGHAIDEGLAI